MERISKELILAIAICILRHKPPERSLTAYIIELREKFPLLQTDTTTARGPPDEGLENQWRTRALALEKENEALKFRLQKYEIASLAAKSSTQTDNSSEVPKRKKKVDKKVTPEDPNTLRNLLNELVSGPGLPPLQESLDILSSFHTLKKNTNTNGDLEVSEFNTGTVLIPNIKRSLKALSRLLEALLKDDSNGFIIARSAKLNVANRFRDLLLSLLRSTLPLAPRHTVLSHIMEELCIEILRPAIQGFHLTSVKIFRPTRGGVDDGYAEIDVRPSLLRVIQQLVECLQGLKEKTRELREFLVVETAKEIASLWKLKDIPKESDWSLEERLQRLARKDSLWYHCAVINLALEKLQDDSVEDNDPSVLSITAADLLYDLPRIFEHQLPVDTMAQGMILAIVEKAWLKGLCVCDWEGVDEEREDEMTQDHSTVYESLSSHI